MPNAAVVRDFPIHNTTTEPRDKGELSRLIKILIWTGTLMAQPNTPRGWGWNPSVITLCLVIGGIVGSAGFAVGWLMKTVDYLEKSNQATQTVANTAKDRADYALKESDKGDGHRANSNIQETKR